VQKQGLLPLSQKSTFILASLAYHDYEGLAVSEGEKLRLVRDLGEKRFLMLRNHGLITIGETVADAFLFMYQFEAACTIQVRAQAAPGELILINPDVLATVSERLKQVLRGSGGALVWPALLRKLDQFDKTYRS
jgi:ribulose-5-phosphate 4-epimerase/fuculose-1-phosphate aldolase